MSSSKNDYACESFSHCCVDTKGEGERVKMIGGGGSGGVVEQTICFSSKFSKWWDVQSRVNKFNNIGFCVVSFLLQVETDLKWNIYILAKAKLFII